MSTILKSFCDCGNEITVVPEFDGLPCNTHCCACCDYAKTSPCPKEQQFGGIAEALKGF